MSFRFPKKEKLKQKYFFDLLFSQGKSKYAYPLKLMWVTHPQTKDSAPPLQIGVSVPKRLFRKAVDRNQLKRLMREGVRHHKERIPIGPNQTIILLIYTSNKKEPYQKIESSISYLTKFLEKQLTHIKGA